MTLQLEVLPDADAAVRRVAALIAGRARKDGDGFSLAVSRGARLFQALGEEDVPWERVAIYQVDERVAPPGHPDRNLIELLDALPSEARPDLRPMPVDDPDLDAAATRYAAELPERLDLVHLGLGEDGHTASLIPGDPVLEVRDHPVAVTGEYQGWRRMTLTYPALGWAHEIVWLVTGERKREPLAKLLAGDRSIPAARVVNERQLLVVDEAAAG